jgi:hypothetical protein
MSRPFPRMRAASAVAAVLAGLLLAAAPSPAQASACEPEVLTQRFAHWGDPARYFLAPDGHFDEDGTGWTLSGGAGVAADEGPDALAGARALQLPTGSSATSSLMCIDIDYPTIRFFARNTGDRNAKLNVTVRFRLADGQWRSLKLADLTAGATLQPTRVVWLLANYLSVYPTWDHQVALRFTPVGDDGTWTIDDVHVDPYAR